MYSTGITTVAQPSVHTPDVLYERLNSGAEQFPGYVCGVDGEAKSLCFSPHHIVKLVSKQRDSQYRNSMVHCLQQAVLSTMGNEETRSFVALGKHKTEKASLLREESQRVLGVIQPDR